MAFVLLGPLLLLLLLLRPAATQFNIATITPSPTPTNAAGATPRPVPTPANATGAVVTSISAPGGTSVVTGTNIEIDVTLEPTNAAAPVGIQTIVLEWGGSSGSFLPNTTFFGQRDNDPFSFLSDSRGSVVIIPGPGNGPSGPAIVVWGGLGITSNILPNFVTTLVNPFYKIRLFGTALSPGELNFRVTIVPSAGQPPIPQQANYLPVATASITFTVALLTTNIVPLISAPQSAPGITVQPTTFPASTPALVPSPAPNPTGPISTSGGFPTSTPGTTLSSLCACPSLGV